MARTLKREVTAGANRLADPEKVHEQMIDKLEKDTDYYRLNNPRTLRVGLGEWKPKKAKGDKPSGYLTMKEIRQNYLQWIEKNENQDMLKDCAKKLVAERRRRADGCPQWERFATGAHYRCCYKGCHLTESYNGKEHKVHLLESHPVDEGEELDKLIENKCKKWWQYPRHGAKPAPRRK